MLVGRGDIRQVTGHERADMPGDEFPHQQVIRRRTGQHRHQNPGQEDHSGQRRGGAQPTPGPGARMYFGAVGFSHRCPHALVQMRRRAEIEFVALDGHAQRLMSLVYVCAGLTILQVSFDFHASDDIQFPVDIPVEQGLGLLTMHVRPPAAGERPTRPAAACEHETSVT
jgi:hypothetical protein